MPNNEKIILGGIDESSRPQILTILSELTNASSILVSSSKDSKQSLLSANDAAAIFAKNLTNVRVRLTIVDTIFSKYEVSYNDLLITAHFNIAQLFFINKSTTPTNFKTPSDLHEAIMRLFCMSRNTVFGHAEISAMPSVRQDLCTSQFEFLNYLKPQSTTISVFYKTEYSKDTAYVIIKNFTFGSSVTYARCEISVSNLNKALGGSHAYGVITQPETVLDKLIANH